MMNLNNIGAQVIELVKEVGSFITSERAGFSMQQVESKGLHDFVSYVDEQAEQKLVGELKNILPEAGFITEENTAGNSNEDYLWVIDPLDGTTNFIHKVIPHAISIALLYKQEAILGVVYEVGLKEAFYSWKGTAVFCNGQQVKISGNNKLSDSLVATGFHINKFEKLSLQLKIVDKIIRNSHGLRRHGSAATDLAYVAAGRFDAFFEHELNPWDVAAGTFLVKQAGGVVSDYSGENNFIFGREVLAGSPGAHEELLEIIKSELR